MNQYSLFLQWSEDDQLFLVTIPEFSDDLRSVVDHRVIMPCTYGKTREEAIHNGEEVIEMYLEAWEAVGETIPKPRTLQTA
jgi:predicted RNase H-like HicB family nuclease